MQNNKMELLNNEIRNREKTMQGLKNKDSIILRGYRLFHNYIISHNTLDNITPGEKCGIVINGSNKWITAIENTSENERRIREG